MLLGHGVAEGEGTASPDQRRLDRRSRDGDRRGPSLRGQPLRAHRPDRMGERDIGLRAAGHTGGDDSMESMRNRMRWRRLRGLVLHHRRHPSAHPRRLVTRTASWGEPPVRGACRWCHEHTPALDTWHDYCLAAYRVASGQKPGGIQVTMCEGLRRSCHGVRPQARHQRRPDDGTGRAQEGVHPGEPPVALQPLPPAQDPAGPQARAVPGGLLAGLARCPEGLESQPHLGGRVPQPSRDS